MEDGVMDRLCVVFKLMKANVIRKQNQNTAISTVETGLRDHLEVEYVCILLYLNQIPVSLGLIS